MTQKNKLILGTVQMGLHYGINNSNGQISEKDSIQIFEKAFENGIQILDTAEAYGTAHNVIGKYHKLNNSSKFKVITKLPHIINDNISFKVENYLEQLEVNSLYALLFHSYSTYNENKENISLLSSLKKEGKIDKIGVSVYTNQEIDDVINDENIDIIQLPFNLFDNVYQREKAINKIKEKNKLVHTRSCYLQGLFFSSPNSTVKICNELKTELSLIREISKKYNVSIQRIALNYCLQSKNIDNVLIGIDNLDQLKSNLEDSKYSIQSELVNEINLIRIQNTNLLNPSLWNNL